MIRPRIGLTVKRGRPHTHPKNRYYVERLVESGAEVVFLNDLDITTEKAEAIMASLQGILLGGGGDVHPRYYNAPCNGTNPDSVDTVRDELEFFLVRVALERELPILGICRGFQVLNVALGGTLIQHVDGHSSEGQDQATVHRVRVRPHTRLWEALGRVEELVVNSHHHQAAGEADLAPLLTASAWTETFPHIVEGIELPDHRWFIGVQWHPERLHEFEGISREAQRNLFQSFVRAAALVPVR